MPRMLDIYSGLGGASEAFVRAGWEVHRLENNVLLRDVPHTKLTDVTTWPFQEIPAGYYDFVWASPPCTEFSNAYGAPKSVAAREGIDYFPDLSLLHRAREIIEHLMPVYYIIENVAGASKIFSQELGVNGPRQIIGPFYLWGVFPYIPIDWDFKHSKFENDTWSSDPLRANKRGKIPIELSEAVLHTLERQTKLTDW